jgi:hypothetical protein
VFGQEARSGSSFYSLWPEIESLCRLRGSKVEELGSLAMFKGVDAWSMLVSLAALDDEAENQRDLFKQRCSTRALKYVV